jgi:hypothetical protein
MAADDYVVLTVLSQPGEAEAAFKARMAAFWTHMVRNRPDDYEKCYAEATKFQRRGDVLTRQYFVEVGVADVLTAEWTAAGLAADAPDLDDTYSKYEATPPDWFWIEH